MTAEEFALNFYKERKSIIEDLFDLNKSSQSYVSSKIESLKLDDQQTEKIKHIISALLTDTFYGILLGLDGCATIGGTQEMFKIIDEDGNVISDGGDLEAEAFELFHENRLEVENSDCDFVAALYFKSTEEGGREQFALSGYRPQVRFSFTDIQTSGHQIYIDNKMAFPGDNINALIQLTTTEHLKGQLKEGTMFDFLEGDIVIGNGRILRIKNDNLYKASR